MKLHVAHRPCNTCPYRRKTPPGIWHPDEYDKLDDYDEGQEEIAIAVFHCHQENATGAPTVCRGWLTVHSESIAVRLAMLNGQVTPDEVYAEVPDELYETGAEAREAGLAGVEHPDARAVQAIDRLVQKGVGKWDD